MSDDYEGRFLRTIAEGLRHAIRDHGPITAEWIGSASKRVYSRLKGTKYAAHRASVAAPPRSGTVEQLDGSVATFWPPSSPVAATVDAETAKCVNCAESIVRSVGQWDHEFPYLPECFDAVPAAPSDSSIQAAAAEIVEMFNGWMSLERRINEIAAILSKYLGSAAVGENSVDKESY